MEIITFKHWLMDYVEGFFSAAAAGGVAYLSSRMVSAKNKMLAKMDQGTKAAQAKIESRIGPSQMKK